MTPLPAAMIGVPAAQAQSTPVCILGICRMGWRRTPKPEVMRTSSPRTGRRIRNLREVLPCSS